MLSINKIHYPVTVLGYGKRIGIWTQGCSIRCAGCISQDTWQVEPEKSVPLKSLMEYIKNFKNAPLDGITISGGEPFDQAEGLYQFLIELNQWKKMLNHPFDILCYSGYSHKKLKEQHLKILDLLDVLISEPYDKNLPTAYLRGSSNQKIIPLSELGLLRYPEDNTTNTKKQFQVHVDKNQVWMVGIPNRDDMENLQIYCEKNGLILQTNSWQGDR